MTTFIIVCVAMLLAALLWMVLPLLRAPRDGSVASESTELASYRAERRFSGLAVALLLPVLAVVMYAGLSNWDWKAVQIESEQAQNMEQAVAGLEAKLKENPNNLDGWIMLGRSYTAMGRYPRAADAYQQAYDLSKGQNVEAIVGLGEALALTDEASLTGRAGKLFESALAIAPNHPKALWYGGVAALRSGDLRLGRDRLQLLLAQNPPDEIRNVLARQIQDLDEQIADAGTAATAPAQAQTPSSAPAAGTRAIQVSVSLSPQLRQQVTGALPLFILARDASAGGPPLAVQRHGSDSLPLNVTLSESDAMIPSRSIATVPKVVVVARLSRSGAPQQQSGDLYGEAEYEFGKSSGPLTIVIDRVVP
ncbi:tetratricopeptide repeat protein [Steroidobacter cummioxidans]|uniref:tetratricopeptide repeat protein n=1 Tax=Steroidobacter cummioxidans TaxID=1803913 RepID=UPI000E315DC4|nr:tetratricopeptide repeat protein [Steroidobacter cummioxidans]